VDLTGWPSTVLSVACVGIGALVLLRGLFADRARGRRRCPRCWYDLSAAASRICSECGYEVRRDRQYFRTRRHWRAAMLGILAALAGMCIHYASIVSRVGYIKALPTIGYIAALPHLHSKNQFSEIRDRLEEGDMRLWEYWLLSWRCHGMLDRNENKASILRTLHLLSDMQYRFNVYPVAKPWGTWASPFEHCGSELVETVAALVRHDDREVRLMALSLLNQDQRSHPELLPLFIGTCRDLDISVSRAASHCVGRIECQLPDRPLDRYDGRFASLVLERAMPGTKYHNVALDALCSDLLRSADDPVNAVNVLQSAIESKDEMVRAVAMSALGRMTAGDVDAVQRLTTWFANRDEGSRIAVVCATPWYPYDAVRPVLEKAFSDSRLAMFAARAAGTFGTRAAEFAQEIQVVLKTVNAAHVVPVATSYLKVGGSEKACVDVLLDRLEVECQWNDADARVVRILDALALCSVRSDRGTRMIEPFMRHRNGVTQSAAAIAYVSLGGDDLAQATRCAIAGMSSSGNMFEPNAQWGVKFAMVGKVALDVVSTELRSDDAVRRLKAVCFLFECWHAGVPLRSAVERLLDDDDPSVRRMSAATVQRLLWCETSGQGAGRSCECGTGINAPAQLTP
jgi:hypothetical protein